MGTMSWLATKAGTDLYLRNDEAFGYKSFYMKGFYPATDRPGRKQKVYEYDN